MNNCRDRAFKSIVRVLDRISEDVFLTQVDIFLQCSHGGISKIDIDWSEKEVETRELGKIEKKDNPDKILNAFADFIQDIESRRWSGDAKFRVLADFSRAYGYGINLGSVEIFRNK